MTEPRFFVEGTVGDHEPRLDVVCSVCAGRFSLMPDQSVLAQVLAFLDRHRHDAEACQAP